MFKWDFLLPLKSENHWHSQSSSQQGSHSFLIYSVMHCLKKWTLTVLTSFPYFIGSLENAYVFEVGKNAYLPCSYTLSTPGALVPMCWGKGFCPWSQCTNELLRTDEKNVTYQKSSRYQLKGDLNKGDVSLIIKNVTLDDHGTYCCRIQFPGLMNDKKLELKLDIKAGE